MSQSNEKTVSRPISSIELNDEISVGESVDGTVKHSINDFEQTVMVNGKSEFEERWSLPKKVLMQVFFWICIVDSLFMTFLFLIFVRPFLGKKNPMKNDRRQWPVSLLLYTRASAVVYLKHHATTWQAIEYLYTWDEHVKDLRGYDKFLSDLLGSVENILATRNRFRNLKRELFWEIDRLIQIRKEKITIVSLAAGSARGPIEVITYFLKKDPSLLPKVTLYLVDFDEEAYAFAFKLAQEKFPGLEKKLVYYKALISSKPEGLKELGDFLAKAQANVTEMVGFPDYMDKPKAIKVMSLIGEHMAPDGLFLTNNVKPNDERIFLQTVVTWRMVNRTEIEFVNILKESGYQTFRTLNEPTNIQPVYVARR